jgi:hypothetical protein
MLSALLFPVLLFPVLALAQRRRGRRARSRRRTPRERADGASGSTRAWPQAELDPTPRRHQAGVAPAIVAP